MQTLINGQMTPQIKTSPKKNKTDEKQKFLLTELIL